MVIELIKQKFNKPCDTIKLDSLLHRFIYLLSQTAYDLNFKFMVIRYAGETYNHVTLRN
jgi:hypothetical protein